MKLKCYELDNRRFYGAYVWELDNKCILQDFYTTKAEAIKAVKTCKKNYKGNKELDCYVRLYDENEFEIEDYNL